MKKGKVTLVSAGVGSTSLMTVKGKKILENAEVVVYDRLLGEGVTDLIPENAEKINVGKKADHHPIPQYEINSILVQKANEGKNVVRLKGGDSYLFGRGGEEVEELIKNGIEFEVISGVTSAIAAPAYAGIPVTHRDCASSVHIITGHNKKGKSLDINYKACVDIGGTLVFLMGVKNLAVIADGLISNGMREDMPCAVIERGATPQQKKVVATIGDIAEKAKDLKSPSVIVVGEVCRYSDDMDWFSKLPLFGKSIAITRAREKAISLAEKLRDLGASVVISPCIKTESLDFDTNEVTKLINSTDCTAFTSPVGVKTVFESLLESGKDARIFAYKKIAAVGKKTAEALKHYGIIADIIPEEHNGGALADCLAGKAESVLILRAEKGTKELTEKLESNDISYVDMAVYRTVLTETKTELPEKIDYVVFASPSEAEGFARLNIKATAVCIGAKTAARAMKLGFECIVATKQSEDGIVAALVERCC